MTVIERNSPSRTQPVTVDLYRDIHKGIRAELFAITGEAGRIDPASAAARAALAAHVHQVVEVLETHAGKEDEVIQPAVEEHLPALAERICADHQRFDLRTAELTALADETAATHGPSRAEAVRNLYLEVAEFTGVYLVHQDVEERAVLPALEQAVGPDAVLAMQLAIVGSIPPPELAASLAFMLPAMNIDNRAELLGGIRAGAPAPMFEGVWGLAGSVLTPADQAALGLRLGICEPR
jgi:iron-sulfur cluster repair protein YtfE (RIC family)